MIISKQFSSHCLFVRFISIRILSLLLLLVVFKIKVFAPFSPDILGLYETNQRHSVDFYFSGSIYFIKFTFVTYMHGLAVNMK